MKEIIFLADGRDFHAIDWYRTIVKICSDRKVFLATDIFNAEGREALFNETDQVIPLYKIDRWLFGSQSTWGNLWRNFIKILFFPLQVIHLKRLAKKYPNSVFHAHTMYYLFISWQAGIEYIGSPQGDEILIRPFRSRLYYYFAKRSLKRAKHLIVDSQNLKNGIKRIADQNADIVQYGIGVSTIVEVVERDTIRSGIVSIRAWYPLYRIARIIEERNAKLPEEPIVFFFPFSEEGYVKRIMSIVSSKDKILGRLPEKVDVYRLLSQAQLVISIPESDSSPRSVYESIFCGCAVAVTYNPWIESLPSCMKERVIIVDINKSGWLSQALEASQDIVNVRYVPSEAALEMFDQERSMQRVANKYYI